MDGSRAVASEKLILRSFDIDDDDDGDAEDGMEADDGEW